MFASGNRYDGHDGQNLNRHMFSAHRNDRSIFSWVLSQIFSQVAKEAPLMLSVYSLTHPRDLHLLGTDALGRRALQLAGTLRLQPVVQRLLRDT
jgi:hypothetical protein